MLNNVTLMGRLTKAPELRYSTTQKPVASFTLAVERDFASAGGEKGTDFIQCTAWNGTAEFVNRYFDKGQMAAVNGRLQNREWTDKDGKRHTVTEVVAASVYFASPKKNEGKFEEVNEPDAELPF